MISRKRTTLALTTLAIALVIAVYASNPVITTHQAVAFHGRFHGGFHRGFHHSLGFGGFGFPGRGCGGGCGCGFGGCWANLW
ncbi:MAG: hypothetical protein WBZ36_17185 [Candidatus Nitrosopolaris sp.]